MKDLEEVLNCIGDFSCYISDKIVSFSGTLNNTEKDIVLRCNMGIERYREINKCSPPNMWGNVNGIPVLLSKRNPTNLDRFSSLCNENTQAHLSNGLGCSHYRFLCAILIDAPYFF